MNMMPIFEKFSIIELKKKRNCKFGNQYKGSGIYSKKEFLWGKNPK